MPTWVGTRVEFYDFKDWWNWVGRYKKEIYDLQIKYPYATTCLIGLSSYYEEQFSPAYGNPGSDTYKCPCLIAQYREMLRDEYNSTIQVFVSCSTVKTALHEALQLQEPNIVVTNIWWMSAADTLPIHTT